MDNIRQLEEIGLKKVSDETHIELKYLKYMVNSDFDKLNHINTLGFVKILSREYGIDLAAWAESFEEYWQANRQEEQDSGMFIVVESQKEGRKLFTFLVVLVFIGIIAVSFSFLKDKLDMPQFSGQEEQQFYTPTETVEETKASLEDYDSEQNSLDIQDSQEMIADANITESNESIIKEEPVVAPQKKSNEEKVIVQEESVTQKDSNVTKKTETVFEQSLVIEPKTELWVGVIYLDDLSRRSYLGEEAYSLDLNREQIITTGHGSFDLKGENYTKTYNSQDPIRLWIKDNNVTQISWSKFKELNQGSAW